MQSERLMRSRGHGDLRPMPSNYRREGLIRSRLPQPLDFYAAEGILLPGRTAWRSAICVFHDDKRPSLRISIETGAFRCMACGVRGGDILAFYGLRRGVTFSDAAKALGAWGVA